MELVYYPPYHSKYNIFERCWGILEKHWYGTQLKTIRGRSAVGEVDDLEVCITYRGVHRQELLHRYNPDQAGLCKDKSRPRAQSWPRKVVRHHQATTSKFSTVANENLVIRKAPCTSLLDRSPFTSGTGGVNIGIAD